MSRLSADKVVPATSGSYVPLYKNTLADLKADIDIKAGMVCFIKGRPAPYLAVSGGVMTNDDGSAFASTGVLGMTEINNGVYVVANAAANTYELTGINSTSYTTYTSGGTSETPKGKFHCAGDFTLSHKQDRIAFQWDQTEAAWCEISRSDNTV